LPFCCGRWRAVLVLGVLVLGVLVLGVLVVGFGTVGASVVVLRLAVRGRTMAS